jgi:hypothetical protein
VLDNRVPNAKNNTTHKSGVFVSPRKSGTRRRVHKAQRLDRIEIRSLDIDLQIAAVLNDLGYRRFKLVDQREKNQLNLWRWNWKRPLCLDALHVILVGTVRGGSSGSMGDPEEVIAALAKAETGGAPFKGHATWYDFYATF